MNDKEYIGISAFADMVNVSVQNIYERIKKKDNAIQKYVKTDCKPYKIHISAVEELYGKNHSSTCSSPLSSTLKVENEDAKKIPLQNPSTGNDASGEMLYYKKIIAVLENQIEEQKNELKTKDTIIANMTERLGTSQKLLDQQQQLALADKQKILMLEEKNKEQEQISIEDKQKILMLEQEQKKYEYQQPQKKWYEFWK